MAQYTVNTGNGVGNAWVTLPTPAADAWVQPINGDIRITTATGTPNPQRCLLVKKGIPFPITSGRTNVRIQATRRDQLVHVVMEDKP